MQNKNIKSLYNSEKNLRDNNDINDENIMILMMKIILIILIQMKIILKR